MARTNAEHVRTGTMPADKLILDNVVRRRRLLLRRDPEVAGTDVVYLVVDLTVCRGIFARWRPALGFFAAAALSQVVLYTVLRGWIIDVPAPYTVTPEEANYLTTLVLFHVTTPVLVFGAFRLAGPAHFWRPRTAAA